MTALHEKEGLLPEDFTLDEWKGKVAPENYRREMINLAIITTIFVLIGFAAATGFLMWVVWSCQLIFG